MFIIVVVVVVAYIVKKKKKCFKYRTKQSYMYKAMAQDFYSCENYTKQLTRTTSIQSKQTEKTFRL